MDFLDQLENTLSTAGREVADKAKAAMGTASLNAQISVQEEVIRKGYLELGRLYYEEYQDVPDAPYEKQRKAIAKAREEVRHLQEQIKMLKR